MKTAGISYDRAGDGEPLLLLHGTGGSRRHWAPLWSLLAAQRELVAVDLPGHGHSDPPPSDGDHTPVGYAATLNGFPGQAWHRHGSCRRRLGRGLDGARAGEAGASTLGCRHRASRALGPTRSVAVRSQTLGMYRLGRLTGPLTDRALRSEAGRTRLLGGTVAKPLNLSEEEARDLISTYNNTPTFTKHLAQTRRARFRDGASIEVPVTVAWGDDEQLIPPKARRQDELPPHTTTVTLAGCGHVPFWDDPEQVAQMILKATSYAPSLETTPAPGRSAPV